MTHAATQAEVKQGLKRAELMIGDPRVDVRWMAERINKLVESLKRISEKGELFTLSTDFGAGVVNGRRECAQIAHQALADYYGTKEGE